MYTVGREEFRTGDEEQVCGSESFCHFGPHQSEPTQQGDKTHLPKD